MRYFVIMGNTRVGSTWLSAAANSLPGVFCTREIRWRMPYMDQAPPVHTYIESTTGSIKERLDFGYAASGRKRTAVAIGAKLKFDPVGYAPPSAFSDLGRIVEDDVHIVFLRRRYFEIFATWKSFGIRHLANPDARRKSKKVADELPEAEKQRNRFQEMHSRPLDQKLVCITGDDGALVRFLRNRTLASGTLYYAVSDAIDDMLVLFYNDVLGLTAVWDHPNVDVFHYQDIRSKFFPVMQRVGLDVSEAECLDALDNASTRQIEPPGAKLVSPDRGLKAISDHLESVFDKIKADEIEVGDVVRVDEAKGIIRFHLPELGSVLERHRETQFLARSARRPMGPLRRVLTPMGRVEGHYPRSLRMMRGLFAGSRLQDEYWFAQRPLYVPVPFAPTVSSQRNDR